MTEQPIINLLDAIQQTKTKLGFLEGLRSKRFGFVLLFDSVLCALGVPLLKSDVWAGVAIFGLATLNVAAYVFGQSYVDGQRMRALGTAAVAKNHEA